MRAAAQDLEIAETQGVNTRRTYKIAFFVAILLAALAGALWGQIYAVSPFLGERPLMMAFIVVILGGMGSIPGAALGGVIAGLHRELRRHVLRRRRVGLPVVRRRHPAAHRAPMGHPRHPGDREMTQAKRSYIWVVAAIALLGWPWLTDDKFFHHVGVLICLTSIGAASLHLIIRTGHVSLGHAAFAGHRRLRLGDHDDAARLPWPVGLVVGVGARGAARGRRRPDRAPAHGQVLRAHHLPVRRDGAHGDRRGRWLTGGSNGIFNVPPPHPILLSNRAATTTSRWPSRCSASACARASSRREYGRAMDAIREGERLAECSGVPVIRFKVTVFVIACALAGLQGVAAGALHHAMSAPRATRWSSR